MDSGNGQEVSCSGHCCNLCDETQFNELLALERKRAERSRRPFILMLLDIIKLPSNMNGNGPARTIASRLLASTREIDTKGWYNNEEIIGVLFTELGEMNVSEAKEKIHERVFSALRPVLDPHLPRNLRVSFHVFPEDLEGSESKHSSDPRLYPDLTRVD